MSIADKIRKTIDLQRGVELHQLGRLFGTNETLGHEFIITVLDGGNPVDLTGATIVGYFVRSDDATVAIDGANVSVSGNEASVSLPQNCYAVTGRFTLVIRATLNGVTHAIYYATGYVVRSYTDQIDATETVKMLDELEERIDGLEDRVDAVAASIPAEYSDMVSHVAEMFSASKPYSAGQYVWNGSKLYKFTAIHAPGAWTGTDAEEVVLGKDTAALTEGPAYRKAEFASGTGSYTYVQGNLSSQSASTVSATNRIRTHLTLPEGVLGMKLPDGMEACMYAFDAENTYVGRYVGEGTFSKSVAGGLASAFEDDFTFEEIGGQPGWRYKAVIRRTDDTDIVPADAADVLYYYATDTSLTQTNKAADAKSVGDQFAAVDASVTGLSGDVGTAEGRLDLIDILIDNKAAEVPEVVKADMTVSEFMAALNPYTKDDGAYTALCKCSSKSFRQLVQLSSFEEIYPLLNGIFRQEVWKDGMTHKTVCERVNRALTKPIRRFMDAKLSDTACDFSLLLGNSLPVFDTATAYAVGDRVSYEGLPYQFTAEHSAGAWNSAHVTGITSGEPSLYVSPDGGTLYVYGYNKRWHTNDGMKWYGPEYIVLSDGGSFGHAGFSVIDDTIYMIARDYRNNNDLIMYTSPITDGINFTYRGIVLDKGHDFGDGIKCDNWGNSYMLRNGDTYYLYIEGRQDAVKVGTETVIPAGNFWDIYLVTCTDPFAPQQGGTIGDWVNATPIDLPVFSENTAYAAKDEVLLKDGQGKTIGVFKFTMTHSAGPMKRLTQNGDYMECGDVRHVASAPNGTTAFSAAKAYAAGDFVTSGALYYKFIADHPAGAWLGPDVKQVPYGLQRGREFFPAVTSAIACGNPDFAKGPDNRPVCVNGKWYMYFHATAASNAYILRARSDDLKHWTFENRLLDNRVKPSGGQTTNSSNADHAVIEFKGRTYLFYTSDINTALTPKLRYMIDDRPIREMLELIP